MGIAVPGVMLRRVALRLRSSLGAGGGEPGAPAKGLGLLLNAEPSSLTSSGLPVWPWASQPAHLPGRVGQVMRGQCGHAGRQESLCFMRCTA